MASDLKKKVLKGSIWSFAENFAHLGIGFVFSIILARLLQPEDYGVVAMLAIFIALSNTFVNSGFASALIRKPDRSEIDNSTSFYFNIAVGVICYFLLFVSSPLVAAFYNMPLLSPVLKVSALSVVFNSLSVVQHAQLSIRMDFKTLAKITIFCNIITGLVGLYFAYTGWGVWALVFQSVTSSFVRMCLLWLFAKWRPITGFSRDSFKNLFNYGSKILASGILNTGYNNIYPIVIGKFFSPVQLGLYSRGQVFATIASDNITSVIERVTFPALSTIQNEDERLESSYRRLIKVSAFIIFPISLLMAAIASPLVDILLTPKWSGCVVFLQIMCLDRMWLPIHALNLNLLKVKGRSDLFLRLEIIKKIFGIIVICISLPFGLEALCWGGVVSSIVSLIINTHYTGELINVGFMRQMLDIAPTLVISFLMSGFAILPTFLFKNSFFQLFFGVIIGLVVFFGISLLIKRPEIKEIRGAFKNN